MVVHQVHQDQEAYLDFLARMVKVAWMGSPGRVDPQVLQAKEDCRACQVFQVLKDIEASLVSMGLKEMLEDQAKKERRDPQVEWGHQDH